jgi:hypothetical protein
MFNGNSSDGVVLREEIFKVDQRRKQNLKDVAPELAQIIGYK